MDNVNKPHLKIDGFSQNLVYKYPKEGGGSFEVAPQNRAIHGQYISKQLDAIRQQFQIDKETELSEGIIRDDAVYVEFTSEWGYELAFSSLEKDLFKDAQFQLLNVIEEKRVFAEKEQNRYHATVLLIEGGISDFIEKINLYINKNTEYTDRKTKQKIITDNPRNYKLFNNIHSIQIATLRAFWTDAPEIPFPDTEESIWWEVWFRITSDDNRRISNVVNNLENSGCIIGKSQLILTEHIVQLIKGTINQLSHSLLLLDNLAELRKPQEIADFINHKTVSYEDKKQYLEDLTARTEILTNTESVLVCLLDSGVNNQHPLLLPCLPDSHLYTYNEAWGTNDSFSYGGHGTGVAGLALYGDLTDALSTPEKIQLFHGLESYKIFHQNHPNDPELYGAITEGAVNTPIVDRPFNSRIFCMTVTDKSFAKSGRPSAWSATLDKIAFGTAFEPKYPQLFIVSSGNVEILKHEDYPIKNARESIHDPAQAYNAIAVGTYTRKDKIHPDKGLLPLAANGGMAPSNSTSLAWESQWPNKPDVVFEGGNSSTDGTDVTDDSDLKLLSTDAEYPNYIFLPFGDTSGAAGLAAKMAAELRTQHPDFWPETIRGLMIHSADWTSAMLDKNPLSKLKEQDARNLLRTFGYGVPNLKRALYSASNSLTLIAEREIQPYKKEKYKGQYNDYHLFRLPWPVDVLRDLQEVDTTLTITLSYYIEPNPGTKRYATNFQYHSHSLDFAVIKPGEELKVFKRRISGAAELPDDEKDGHGEPWTLGRSSAKGSIRKDFITMSAIEMSERNIIAVYPKNGWYKTRKKLNRFDAVVRYSLIVNLHTAEADIYTPVFEMIPLKNLL